MRVALLCVVFMACGKPPPAKPPAAELEITGPASFAGSWVTDGEMDWFYTLTVGADSKVVLVIDRGKMGRCEQKGMLQPGANARTYQLVYEKNTCNPELGGGPFELKVESFTGASLVLAVTAGGTEQKRAYARDPKAAASPQ